MNSVLFAKLIIGNAKGRQYNCKLCLTFAAKVTKFVFKY